MNPRLACAIGLSIVSVFVPRASILAGDDDERHSWNVALGAGLALRPEFPGSDTTETLVLPAMDVRFGTRWFINQDGFGVHAVNNDRWVLSGSVTGDLVRREESDAAYLRGTGDVDRTVLAQLKGSYRTGMITAAVALATDVADEGHGTVADVTLHASSQVLPKLALSYGVGARWIDDEHARTFFGIDAGQSARSGLPLHDAGSGLGEARVSVNALYTLSPRWFISAGGALCQLQGDAEDSPIVEENEYFAANVAALYRF